MRMILDPALLDRHASRIPAVMQLELLKDIVDVMFHSADFDDQLDCDLLVAVIMGKILQNL